MKVLIVGTGAVGSVIARLLCADQDVETVVCGTNDPDRAGEFIDLKDKKIRLATLDAADVKSVAKAAEGVDLVINASLPRFNESIMEAALQVGTDYLDLASELADLKTAEQLAFDERFRRAGLVGLINAGAAPGITNLVARESADELEDRLDSIRFRLVEDMEASEFIFAWSAETTLDDLTAPPLVWKDGEFALTKPFEDAEEYGFPHPFGRRQAFSIYGDEVATLPKYLKVGHVDFKSAGSDIAFAKALSRLGLFNKEPIAFQGQTFVPIEFFKSIAPSVPSPARMRELIESGVVRQANLALVVEADGVSRGHSYRITTSVIFPDLQEVHRRMPGATYISYPTGVAAYLFSKLISRIPTKGVFPPEALGKELRDEIFLELADHGIKVVDQFEKAG